MRLNQSLSMGGALLLNSTHTAQLQESLHETRQSLERSHHAHEVTERSRRQLEAKLEDFQRRYDEMVGVKHTLESQQLGLEHEVKNGLLPLCVCLRGLWLYGLYGIGNDRQMYMYADTP